MLRGLQAQVLQVGQDRAGHHRLIGPACVCVRERKNAHIVVVTIININNNTVAINERAVPHSRTGI